MPGLIWPLEEHADLSILTVGDLCFVFFWGCMLELSLECLSPICCMWCFHCDLDFIMLAFRLKITSHLQIKTDLILTQSELNIQTFICYFSWRDCVPEAIVERIACASLLSDYFSKHSSLQWIFNKICEEIRVHIHVKSFLNMSKPIKVEMLSIRA
jgi:hypothetical protein